MSPTPEVTIIVIAGPAGVGKSTVGRALADMLGWDFLDADLLHASDSIERMRRGIPMREEDRVPWLERVRGAIDRRIAAGRPVVVACSALREQYRRYLTSGLEAARVVVLDAPPEVLRARLDTRTGHFAGARLLEAQLATFERTQDALIIDASRPVQDLVSHIRQLLFPEHGTSS